MAGLTTQPVALPDDWGLVRSLVRCRCPACGGRKHQHHTLCGRCYYALPAGPRQALYRRLGSGYREAVAAAMGLLGRAEFLMPEGPR